MVTTKQFARTQMLAHVTCIDIVCAYTNIVDINFVRYLYVYSGSGFLINSVCYHFTQSKFLMQS